MVIITEDESVSYKRNSFSSCIYGWKSQTDKVALSFTVVLMGIQD